jgi:hypothetical protein
VCLLFEALLNVEPAEKKKKERFLNSRFLDYYGFKRQTCKQAEVSLPQTYIHEMELFLAVLQILPTPQRHLNMALTVLPSGTKNKCLKCPIE